MRPVRWRRRRRLDSRLRGNDGRGGAAWFPLPDRERVRVRVVPRSAERKEKAPAVRRRGLRCAFASRVWRYGTSVLGRSDQTQ